MSTALTSANNAPSAAIVSQPQVAQSANEKSTLVITHNNGDSTTYCCSIETCYGSTIGGCFGGIILGVISAGCCPSAGCIPGWAVAGSVCGGAIGAYLGNEQKNIKLAREGGK